MSTIASLSLTDARHTTSKSLGSTVVQCVDASVLARVGDDAIQMASWLRRLPVGLESVLDAWARSSPAHFEGAVRTADPRLECVARGLPDPHRSWVHSDVRGLVRRFGEITGAEKVRLWFGAVRDDQCRKFHVDHIAYRMISTYAGPGTQWVPEWAIDREALSHPPECPCDANLSIVTHREAIREAVAGEVMLMKGFGHPSGRGVVHRSPPIETTDRIRVTMIVSASRASLERAADSESVQ